MNLEVMQRGQRIIQIHLREVPRLLRAAIVIDDMGHDLEAAHKLLALDYPLDIFGAASPAVHPDNRPGSSPQRA